MIDYLKVIFQIKHEQFGDTTSIKKVKTGIRYQYHKPILVKNNNTSLRVHSLKKGTCIEVSGNFVKYIQGHNIDGTNDLRGLCIDVIRQITIDHNIPVTKIERDQIKRGNFEIKGVDVAGNFRLPSKEEVPLVIREIEYCWREQGMNVSNYGNETVYLDQHSGDISLKIYDKLKELLAHPLPKNFPHRKQLLIYAEGLLRAELTLGSAELKRRGLDKGANWSNELAKNLLIEEIAATGIHGDIKRLLLPDEFEDLPHDLKQIYRLWLHGDDVRSLFDYQTLRRRRDALLQYGINISQPRPKDRTISVDLQSLLSEENMTSIPSFAKKHGLIHLPAPRNRDGSIRR